jgi:hypothetical protein
MSKTTYEKILKKNNKIIEVISAGLDNDAFTIKELQSLKHLFSAHVAALTHTLNSYSDPSTDDGVERDTSTQNEPEKSGVTTVIEELMEDILGTAPRADTTEPEDDLSVNPYLKADDTEAFRYAIIGVQQVSKKQLSHSEVLRYRAASEKLDELFGK